MNQEKFRGTAKECFAHFMSTAFKTDAQLRRFFFKFLKRRAGEENIQRWVKGEHFPIGENLLWLQHCLRQVGYDVTELNSLSEGALQCGRLITCRTVTLSDLQRELKYGDSGTLIRILTGKRKTSKKRDAQMWEFFERHRAKMAQSNANPPEPNASVATEENGAHKLILSTLVSLIGSMEPLVTEVLSEKFTPEERRLLREQAGGDGVFRLANKLNRLCGEKARRVIPEQVESQKEVETA